MLWVLWIVEQEYRLVSWSTFTTGVLQCLGTRSSDVSCVIANAHHSSPGLCPWNDPRPSVPILPPGLGYATDLPTQNLPPGMFSDILRNPKDLAVMSFGFENAGAMER